MVKYVPGEIHLVNRGGGDSCAYPHTVEDSRRDCGRFYAGRCFRKPFEQIPGKDGSGLFLSCVTACSARWIMGGGLLDLVSRIVAFDSVPQLTHDGLGYQGADPHHGELETVAGPLDLRIPRCRYGTTHWPA